MSIVIGTFEGRDKTKFKEAKYLEVNPKKDQPSLYQPTDDERESISLIRKHYYRGYTTMYTPRIEFNDLSTYHRHVYDQFLWNAYQPNNGQPASEDKINSWRSNALRPIVRNKAISIAAHASARLLYPKTYAYNEQNEQQEDAAKVMAILMEFAGEDGNYAHHSLHSIITALSSPASIGFSEYAEVTRMVKDERLDDGSWALREIPDPQYSGFQFVNVPVDELFIANFFEADIQKQDFLIWRKVISYDTAEIKYGKTANWKFVPPGMQVIMDDANKGYYNKVDNHMRGDEVEEIIYWNRAKDLKLVMVNGVLLTEFDEANPRKDKLYPFRKFGYGIINSRCFYYKSLAFSLQQDATIINTLYRMVIDGTYLTIMPPMVNKGSEKIGANVIVPGMTTNLTDKDASLDPVRTTTESSLNAGLRVLATVDASASESSQDPLQQGQMPQNASTAYQISRVEANAATVLGLFVKMIVDYVKQTGELMKGDILQYLTVVDITKITGDMPLVYKTFMVNPKGKNGAKKVVFDSNMPDKMSESEKINMSFDILNEEGGLKSNSTVYRVNPSLFRELHFTTFVDADTITPRSEELERQFNLETFDRAINSPVADQEAIFTDLLMASNPKTAKDPHKYVKKEEASQVAPNDPSQVLDQAKEKQTMRTPAAPKAIQSSLAQSGAMAM
jgi:hypothetical protein